MARNVVDSPRVHAAVQAMHPGREIVMVLNRGSNPKRTFLVIFADDPTQHGEMVTIPPEPRKKKAKPENCV